MATKIEVKGILSYPHLFVPRAVTPGDDPKFSVNVLIKKTDPQVAVIQAAINTEIANTFPQGFPASGKVCLKDCADYPEYYELRTNSGAENPPHIVQLPTVTPVTDRAKVYAGAVAWCVISINGYNMAANKGIGGYINGVAITGQEGALGRLDNKPSAEQMFSHLAGGAAGAVAPPPVAAAHVMTPAAQGASYEQMIAAGWTDATLVQHGMMLPPGGVKMPWS